MLDFDPPPLLRGRHVQSILGSVGLRRSLVRRRSIEMQSHSEDLIIDCGDGVRLLCHHTPPRDPANQRLALIIHGWEGSASSTYMLSAATSLWQAGYRVIRLNLRDHGDSHHLNKEMFHSCRLSDAVGAVRWAQREFSGESLWVAGFSLGGNFALRIAAVAQPEQLSISGVVAVCPVLDPATTMFALDNGSPIYQLYFLRKWRNSLHKKKAAFPDRYDFSRLERFTTLSEMTEYFVERYTEYATIDSYLRGYALTTGRLESLQVPARLLLAEDDPVIPIGDIDRVTASGRLQIDRSRYGGHCGFIDGYDLRGWADRYILNAFDALNRRDEYDDASAAYRIAG